MPISIVSRAPATGTSSQPSGMAGTTFAAGSVLGAVLASSCCVLPLLFVSLGLGGAWVGSLTALAPYKPYFVAATLLFLGLGHWQVHRRQSSACRVDDGYCANPVSARLTRGALWFATVVVALSMTSGYWAPLFY